MSKRLPKADFLAYDEIATKAMKILESKEDRIFLRVEDFYNLCIAYTTITDIEIDYRGVYQSYAIQ